MTSALASPAPGLGLFKIASDHMQPVLRSGDYLMVAPAEAYTGEGVYVLDFDGSGGSPYMAERVLIMGREEVRIWHPNPKYSLHVIGLDEFAAAVRGKAVADIRMRVTDEQLMEKAA